MHALLRLIACRATSRGADGRMLSGAHAVHAFARASMQGTAYVCLADQRGADFAHEAVELRRGLHDPAGASSVERQ